MDIMSPAARGNGPLDCWKLKDADAAAALSDLVVPMLHDRKADQTLAVAGDATDSVYFVTSGWLVASRSTPDGQRQIIDFILRGQVFDPASGNAGRTSVDLATLTDAKIAIVPRRDWTRLLDAYPELRKHSDRRVAASFCAMAERMLRLGKARADVRIAYALCELCLRSGILRLIDGTRVRLPLTQQVLGDFAGLSSVHVSRTFRDLRQKGILSHGDHMNIVIHDAARLADIAEVDPDDLRTAIIPAP